MGACDMTPKLPFWLATLQALTLVASPRLGLQQNSGMGSMAMGKCKD